MTGIDWPRVRLKDLGTWFGGGTPSKSNPDYWSDGTVPWLSPKDMGAEVLSGTQDRISEAAVLRSSVKIVPAGSVSIVVRSGILERTLPVAVVPFETTLNQDMKAIVPHAGADSRWIAWALRRSERELLRTCRKAGTTVASMEMSRLYDFALPVPPFAEQRRIVDILEDHLSRLDAASADLLGANRRMSQLRNSALGRAWSDAAMSGTFRSVGEAGHVITGTTPSTKHGDVFDGDLPFLTPSDIHTGDKVTSWTRTLRDNGSLMTRTFGPNAVLVVCIGATLGKVGWVDSRVTSNQQINALEMAPTLARAAFVAALMASPSFQKQMWAEASSTTMPILNKSRFSRLTLPLPDTATQDRLLLQLEEIVTAAQQARRAVVRLDAYRASLRRSLLAAAFSGRLTGRSSDMTMVKELAGV